MVTLTVHQDDEIDIDDDAPTEPVDEVADASDDSTGAEPSADGDAVVTPSTPDPENADPSYLPYHVQEYINQTRELESRASSIAVEVESLKDDLKSAKQRYDDAVDELRDLIRRGPDAQARLPFPEDDGPRELGHVTITKPLTTNTSTEPDESWKPTPIVELESLPQPIKDKLLDAGISTVGELADYTSQGNQLTDIKGIGAAKAEKIEAAMEKFWESRNSEGQGDD